MVNNGERQLRGEHERPQAESGRHVLGKEAAEVSLIWVLVTSLTTTEEFGLRSTR